MVVEVFVAVILGVVVVVVLEVVVDLFVDVSDAVVSVVVVVTVDVVGVFVSVAVVVVVICVDVEVDEVDKSAVVAVGVVLELSSSLVTVITGRETNPTKQRQRPKVRLELDSMPHVGFIVPLINPIAKAIGFFKQFLYRLNPTCLYYLY